jgi:hypothetical protein
MFIILFVEISLVETKTHRDVCVEFEIILIFNVYSLHIMET